MTFDEFADHAKGSVEAILKPDRPPTPFVIFDTDDGVNLIAVEPAFFQDADRTRELVGRFVIPLIGERGVSKVGWTYAATRRNVTSEGIEAMQFQADPVDPAPEDIVVALVMDREVHETWVKPTDPAGPWELLPPNEQAGRLLTPVQEALR